MRLISIILVLIIHFNCSGQTIIDSKVFGLINQYRVYNNLPELVWVGKTYDVGLNHVEYLSLIQWCSHDQDIEVDDFEIEPDFGQRFYNKGISVEKVIGENLVMIIDVDSTRPESLACEVLTAWIHSPPHHELLLDNEIRYGKSDFTEKAKQFID